MKRQSIRHHLQPYSILGRRRTTINHAFASALALYEAYDDARVSQAIKDLGQDPEADLVCFYCDKRPAETWDHVFGLVKVEQYAGFGHTLGNLVPCCKQCNSEKGNKNWQEFLKNAATDEDRRVTKVAQMEMYLERYLPPQFGSEQIRELCPEEFEELEMLRKNILNLMKKADEIAETIRLKVRSHIEQKV
ncbi:MAG TPA: hypothetical protein VFU32_10305 [Ktedonobacterales bacterium]|nr:hypothetical protein [Ktedonobacterales bacterium]